MNDPPKSSRRELLKQVSGATIDSVAKKHTPTRAGMKEACHDVTVAIVQELNQPYNRDPNPRCACLVQGTWVRGSQVQDHVAALVYTSDSGDLQRLASYFGGVRILGV